MGDGLVASATNELGQVRISSIRKNLSQNHERPGLRRQFYPRAAPHVRRHPHLAGKWVVSRKLQSMSRVDLQAARANSNRHAHELVALAAAGIPHTAVARAVDLRPVAVRLAAGEHCERSPR